MELSVNSYASDIIGPYVSIGSGADITQTQHNTSSFGDSIDVRHETGFSGFMSFGYGIGHGIRTEIEGDFLQSNISGYKNYDRTFGGMANVLYDIDLKRNFGIDTFVTPYVGAGAGYAMSQYFVTSPTRNITGDQGSFQYQGIVGARFKTPVNHLYANVDYRMIGDTMSRDSYHQDDSRFDNRFNHVFSVGLTYVVGEDKAPEQPVVYNTPVPQPAKTYLVFFEWDKYDLTPEAKKIVDLASISSRSVTTTSIEVNGYTDNTSIHGGSRGENYNQKLSEKRAERVASELILNGVDPTIIVVKGFGEEHPLIKTKPQTQEIQNRRVEIIIK